MFKGKAERKKRWFCSIAVLLHSVSRFIRPAIIHVLIAGVTSESA